MAEAATPTSEQTPAHWRGLINRARSLADALPDLLVEAHHIAGTVISGWHGRRRPGPGETFWQFRPFFDGEPSSRIDWRRSARDDNLYVREKEWEAAHTVWLWPDLSPSMDFGSELAGAVKRDRALVVTLALAEILARAGERVGILGLTRPIASRNAAERLSDELVHAPTRSGYPTLDRVKRFSDVIVISDLLDPLEDTATFFAAIADCGANGHVVQVLDPIEETFPFSGRIEFRDPESGERITAGRAENWAEAYRNLFQAHREGLRRLVQPLGWTFLVHHSDRPASEPLMLIHARFEERREAGLSLRAPGGGR